MECNVSDLVKRGHDQAAELKASCGAVDVRSVAQLISDLATQLDCTALALREMTKKRDAEHADVLVWEKTMFKVCGEDGHKSVAEKFAELQARCAALAAENAGLKSFGDKLDEMHNDLNGEGTGIQGRAEVACQQVVLEAAMEEFDAIKTPSTDAFLAEMRAQDVEMLRKHPAIKLCSLTHVCDEFAAQLRKGGATEEKQSFLSDEDCHAFVKAFTKGAVQ
ncbi:eae-like domain protein [Escherichia coli]|uniref:eae-like domain protein n=1 Tax=Escherichia coli TaxID=562 RepID=UPI0040574891